MVYRVYRRMMRKFARFILGFERCPASYRKNYGAIALELVVITALTAAVIAIFGLLVVIC